MAENTIRDTLAAFDLNVSQTTQIKNLMQAEMRRGLDRDGGSVLKMLPTYVHTIPDGTESGDFLALDLGGTNFRVLKVTLKNRMYEQVETKATLSNEVMTTTGNRLFDHIAEQVAKFSQAHNLGEKSLPLGFTFSFPVEQLSLTSGKLIKWTKKFTASDVEGHDVVVLLKEAFDRRTDVKVDVVALVNDTVGTMMARALVDSNCCAGLILGTGTNACYMEKLSEVKKWKEDTTHDSIIVNMEWGAFGDGPQGGVDEPGALDDFLTSYDRQLDRDSPNRGHQRYEKMISGMYLGEIVRLVLLDLAGRGLAFGGHVGMLYQKGSFESAYLSKIEDSSNSDHSETKKILSNLKLPSLTTTTTVTTSTPGSTVTTTTTTTVSGSVITPNDCELVLNVCRAVSTRAARLAGAGVVAITEKIGATKNGVVAVDGSLFQYHPRFRYVMKEAIDELVPGNGIKLERAEDGSGRGAALVAAVACRMKQKAEK